MGLSYQALPGSYPGDPEAHSLPTDQLVLLLLVAIFANVVLMGAILLLPLRNRVTQATEPPPPPPPEEVAVEVAARQRDPAGDRRETTGEAYERIIRLVSYGFLAVAAVVVGATGIYPATAPAIFVVLGAAGLFLLVVHDALPLGTFGQGRFVLEGGAAIALVTILVSLTGGLDSPFFFGYFLIVAGAALVVRSGTAALAAAIASAVYLATILLTPGREQMGVNELVRVALNVVALWFVAYLASVVAREQRRTRDAAVRLSLYDPLTQLYNRNYFFAVMDREIQRATRTGRRFALVMIDVDDLKPINDRYGHHYGDRMLREIAEVIKQGIRGVDSAARYGGDEFVVLLPETDPTGAFVLAEKLREGVSEIEVPVPEGLLQTSVSVGVVSFPDEGSTADQLLISADAAMYDSKRRGKNRVGGRSAGGRGRQQTAPARRPRTRPGMPVMAPQPEERPEQRQAGPKRGGKSKPKPRSGGAAGGETAAGAKTPAAPRPRPRPVGDQATERRPPQATALRVAGSRRRRFPIVMDDRDVSRVIGHMLGPASSAPSEPSPPPALTEESRRPA
jgi:diguanylate cyclase (GGDEF)-like protein